MKVKTKSRVIVNSEMCKGCQLCVHFCKKNALRVSGSLNSQGYHYAEPDPEGECTACMVCTLVCPDLAIEVYDE